MNISLSQVIWTVICFVLFALVFDRLLMRPVLDNIDKRRAKIDGAKGRRAELEESRRAAEETERQRLAERREKLARENEEKLAEAAAEADKELEELSSDLNESEKIAFARISAREAEADEKLGAAMDGMIESFTNILTTGGDL